MLPLAMCYCGLFLSSLCDCQLRKNQAAHHQLLSGMKAKLLVLFLAVTNVPMALYTSTVHQRGSIDVMGYIHDESLKPTSDDGMSVLFLMPCHSTPFFRYPDCLTYIYWNASKFQLFSWVQWRQIQRQSPVIAVLVAVLNSHLVNRLQVRDQ